jgi:N-dimethylarginine dimethylaminohydrolase
MNEVDRLSQVLLMPVAAAFRDREQIDREWRALNFTAPPDRALAIEQYETFRSLLEGSGAAVVQAAADSDLTLDAVYVRDASLLTPDGLVCCRMGKATRQHEPAAQRRLFVGCGLPIAGVIEAPGLIEGGDVVWFDDRTVAVGRGYRTNDAGIAQLRALVGASVDVLVVPLPHYRGAADVFHLMSIISPVDADLALVYSPLMPVPFREWLIDRGIRLIEVPDDEFESMGANVLAVAPRCVIMLDGNPVTRARLEAAHVDVSVYDGSEISVKGGGGPTCLTRPLARVAQ